MWRYINITPTHLNRHTTIKLYNINVYIMTINTTCNVGIPSMNTIDVNILHRAYVATRAGPVQPTIYVASIPLSL
jgi:hypothetical protein